MGTTSGPQFLSEDGLPYGMPSGASPALHPSTPFGNPPVLQTTVETELLAQMTSLRRKMAKLQERNNLLSSKVDETQRPPNLPRVSRHVPKKVYTDCRHRINDKKDAERHRSPIGVNARLRDSRMRVLGDKSPIRRVQGLDSALESDDEYIPTGGTESSYRSEAPPEYSKARPPSPRRTNEDFSAEDVPSPDPAIRLLFQRIQKMEDDRTRSQVPDWGKLRPGPFTERIKKSRPDREVQPLRIPFYTGVEDPSTHLHSFQSAVGCKGLSDEGQCLLFPSSLTEAALNWFYRLKPGTVDSFDELKQIFLNHFMIQTDRLYSVDDLYTIRQREDEPLREYAARFSHEYLVHSSNWRTYDELMKQVAVHAKAEYFNSKPGPSARKEESATKSYPGRADDSLAGFKRKDDRDSRQGNSKKGRGKYGRNDHRAPLPNHDRAQEVFTLLNTTYETVLMNEHDQIPKPTNRKPNRQDNRDTGKFCRYQ
ncbi:unnamed protein product [Prunus armeniaca]